MELDRGRRPDLSLMASSTVRPDRRLFMGSQRESDRLRPCFGISSVVTFALAFAFASSLTLGFGTFFLSALDSLVVTSFFFFFLGIGVGVVG